MCFTGEDVNRITEEIERQIEPANRCGVFVDRLLELKQRCPKCQKKKAQEDAVASRNMKDIENTLYRQHTRGLSGSNESSSSLRSSKSPSPPGKSEEERFSPYPSPNRQLSVKRSANAEIVERSNAYQDQRGMEASPPIWSSDTSRSRLQTHTSTSPAISTPPTANEDFRLESFNKWLQRIDNPVDASLKVTPSPPRRSPSAMVYNCNSE
jgi:hypothetical protein